MTKNTDANPESGQDTRLDAIRNAVKQGDHNGALSLSREYCAQPDAHARGWLFLAGLLANTQPASAAAAVSIAFESNPKLHERLQEGHRFLRDAAQLLSRDRQQRQARFVEQARQQTDFDPSALAMIESWYRPEQKTNPHREQKPFQALYPGLPDRPWYEAEEFEWVQALSEKTPQIYQELNQWCSSGGETVPYLAGARGDDYVADLHNSRDWSALHLYQNGKSVDACQDHFVETYSALADVPQVELSMMSPEAFFSILKPGTHIKPHYGQANYKLTAHLGLDIPDDCSLTVRGEYRTWQKGECLIFDDSYLHEAKNTASRTRVVLIFEVWNPAVSQQGRECLQRYYQYMSAWRDQRVSLALSEKQIKDTLVHKVLNS